MHSPPWQCETSLVWFLMICAEIRQDVYRRLQSRYAFEPGTWKDLSHCGTILHSEIPGMLD